MPLKVNLKGGSRGDHDPLRWVFVSISQLNWSQSRLNLGVRRNLKSGYFEASKKIIRSTTTPVEIRRETRGSITELGDKSAATGSRWRRHR
ncbi:hypothetical protein EVAR_84709_1 [Eumeta japonica]|uniref:Uncharacterized protein n=1 Tax=Eumeta variegata TaxID=151549 RepID=A0A4C1VQG5_EUMVA|nr:hypothetical protein EVAR_84709_1 [Eumeta japonica]